MPNTITRTACPGTRCAEHNHVPTHRRYVAPASFSGDPFTTALHTCNPHRPGSGWSCPACAPDRYADAMARHATDSIR